MKREKDRERERERERELETYKIIFDLTKKELSYSLFNFLSTYREDETGPLPVKSSPD